MSARTAWRVAAALVLVGGAFAAMALTGPLSAARVRAWGDALGPAGPLLWIGLAGVLGAALFPGPLLAGAAGLLFGVALGTPVALCSALVTAALTFALARWTGATVPERLAGPLRRRPFLAVLWVRLLPGIPYALANAAAGVARVPWRPFLAATALGIAPRTFAYAALGGSLDHLGRPEAIAALAILATMGLATLVATVRLRRSAPGTATSSPAGRSAARP